MALPPPSQSASSNKKEENNDLDSDSIQVVISDRESENESDLPEYHLTDEQERRYRYLLGDSVLFDRFIEAKRRGRSPLDILTSHAHNDHHHEDDEAVHRHRRTEREEDADLLREANQASREPPTPAFSSSPAYVTGGQLRSYQVQGLNWLISLYEHHINGILADEMGLGKTLQTLSLLGYLKHYHPRQSGPHLLVVPKSTLQNWLNECHRWIPSLVAFIFHGDKERRAQLIQERLRGTITWDICITSYEMCLSERAALRRVRWDYLIIDEAHRIKNEASKLAGIVRELHSQHRLLITGTPLQNNLHELWALLNFLLPDIFSSAEDFDAWFAGHSGQAQDVMVQQLRRLLQPFLLRRLKADVEHTLLPKRELNLYVDMSDMQRQWYRRILERDLAAINGLVKGSEGKVRLLNVLMQLRKCCNHPYLFDGAEPGPPFTTDQHLIDNCGKLLILDQLLSRLKAKGSRVLLFSQMSRMLDILEDYCGFRGHKYCRIDGQTPHEERIAAIDEYNRPGSDKFVFLLTTRAGGLGINLATADIVIIYDSDWNPQVDLQAQDRAHRIGQTRQVCVFRLITEHTVEEKIIEKALQKLRLDQLVIQQGKLTNVNKPPTSDEMLAMIRHGAEELFRTPTTNTTADNGKGDQVITDDIEELMKKGEERTKQLHSKYQNVGYEDLQKFAIETSLPLPKGNTLDEDYETSSSTTNLPFTTSLGTTTSEGLLFLQPGRRERKGNYAVDSYFREALRIHPPKPKIIKPPLPKDHFTLHDFQFFPSRLQELMDREVLAYQKEVGYRIPEPESGGTDEAGFEEDHNKWKVDQQAIDNSIPLSEAEQMEKQELTRQGFKDWHRRDYLAFLRGVERYGKDAHNKIDIEGKSQEEVAAYARAFWSNLMSLSDYEKIEAFLEAHEQKKRRDHQIQQLLNRKMAHHRKNRTPLHINYYGGKGKQWTEEEDIFLLQNYGEIGVSREDNLIILRERILKAPQFRFDWFIKTRTVADLQRRCQKLISFIEREAKDIEEREGAGHRSRARSAGGSIWQKEVIMTARAANKKARTK